VKNLDTLWVWCCQTETFLSKTPAKRTLHKEQSPEMLLKAHSGKASHSIITLALRKSIETILPLIRRGGSKKVLNTISSP